MVRADEEGVAHKLIWVDDHPDALFNLEADRVELENLLEKRPFLTAVLNQHLTEMVQAVEAQRGNLQTGGTANLVADEQLLERLRGLGYLD